MTPVYPIADTEIDQFVHDHWAELVPVLAEALAEQPPQLHARLTAAITERGVEYAPASDGRLAFLVDGEPFCAVDVQVFLMPEDGPRH
jgi:hypothetical protein